MAKSKSKLKPGKPVSYKSKKSSSSKSSSKKSKSKLKAGKATDRIAGKVKSIASGLSEKYLGSDVLKSSKSKGTGKKRRSMRYTNVKALNRSSRRLTGFVKTFKKHASSLGYKVERKTKMVKQ